MHGRVIRDFDVEDRGRGFNSGHLSESFFVMDKDLLQFPIPVGRTCYFRFRHTFRTSRAVRLMSAFGGKSEVAVASPSFRF